MFSLMISNLYSSSLSHIKIASVKPDGELVCKMSRGVKVRRCYL